MGLTGEEHKAPAALHQVALTGEVKVTALAGVSTGTALLLANQQRLAQAQECSGDLMPPPAM